MIKCPCGKETKAGKMFCNFDCQKSFHSKGFKMSKERKEWEEKNGKIQDFK